MKYIFPPEPESFNPNDHYPEYFSSKRVNSRIRSYRILIARQKGRHSKKDWIEMKFFFNNTCCRCGGKSGLLNIEKDHIIPIYKGGSDGLENIQPLCALCNSSKGSEIIDWRPIFAKLIGKELPIHYVNKL